MTKESPAARAPTAEEVANDLGERVAARGYVTYDDFKDGLLAAEQRGRKAGIEEAAREAEKGGCDCNFAPCPHDDAGKNIAWSIRALLSAEPKATPPSLPDSAEVATLRLDVAWWQARVEAAERERDEARAFWRSRAEEAWTERDGWKARAEAAEAAQAKLTEALRLLSALAEDGGWPACSDSRGIAVQLIGNALTSVASAPQAPPSDAAEEVK